MIAKNKTRKDHTSHTPMLIEPFISKAVSYIQAGFPFGAPLLSPSTISFTQNWCKFSYIFFHCWTICMHLLLSSFSLSISISAEAEPCCWKLRIFLWEISILETLCAHKNVYAPNNLEISSFFSYMNLEMSICMGVKSSEYLRSNSKPEALWFDAPSREKWCTVHL